MGVHSEPELGEPSDLDQDQLASLRASATSITRELKQLGEQVAALVAAVEALGPSPAGRVTPGRRNESPAAATSTDEADDSMVMTVTVAPLPELAMAAVAETTLRNLPGVRQVSGVKREGDWARFTLDVSPESDLVSEMRAAMPVRFQVTESTPGALTLELEWAWGAN